MYPLFIDLRASTASSPFSKTTKPKYDGYEATQTSESLPNFEKVLSTFQRLTVSSRSARWRRLKDEGDRSRPRRGHGEREPPPPHGGVAPPAVIVEEPPPSIGLFNILHA